MRKIFFCTLYFLLIHNSHLSFGQNLNIDSIKNIILKDKPDTANVRHLLGLAWELSFSNSDTAIIVATNALKKAKKLDWKMGIADSNNDLASFYYDKSDYLHSLNHNNIALSLYKELEQIAIPSQKYNLNDKIANTTCNLGLVYFSQGNYPKALEYYF